MVRTPFCTALFGVLPLLLLTSFSVHCVDILIVDKNGKPLSNAVVSVANESLEHHTEIEISKQNLETGSPQAIAVMDQVNFQYVPHVLLIKQNQWVEFPNSDNVRHHVYSFSQAKPFEIKMYKKGEAKPVHFDKPGIVVLGCNIHDSMIGYIYVADHADTHITDSTGKISLSSSPDKVNVWHAKLSADHTNRVSFDLDTSKTEHTLQLNISVEDNAQTPPANKGFKSKFSRG